MPRSIIVEVRNAVINGISAAVLEFDGSTSVSCSYGWLGGSDDMRREQIYTNRPRATHDPASLKAGRNFRNERMDFDICVWVQDPKSKADELDARLMELGQVVEEFIADNKSGETLAVTGLNWLRVSAFELENRVSLTGTGSASLGQYTVTYDARLT